MFVCCECCVLSGRGLCDELITRPEESYLSVVCLTECYCEASIMRRPCPTGASCAMERRKHILYFYNILNKISLIAVVCE
jgi:hypothetical protein